MSRVTRRAFLRSASTSLGAGLAAPYVLARGAGGTAPSDRVAVGHIGIGGMGGGHLADMVRRSDAAVVAVCDVDDSRCTNAYRVTGGKARMFRDFRDLLDESAADAVVVASPDHWHALHTLHACEAGKDVYCEKPLSVTVREGQAMVRTTRRYARVVQMGTQWRSMAGRHVAQFVRNGHCGRVREVRCWHSPNPWAAHTPPAEPPKTLDWDLWLGPARWIPFHPGLCPGNFRWVLWSGGGNLRDRGAHIFSIVSWAMNVDHTGPVSVEATGTPRPGLYDNPVTMGARWEFQNPDWTLRWDQPGEPHGGEYGAHFLGDRDALAFWDSFRTEPKVMVEPRPGEIALERSTNHMTNFLDCVRSRQRPIMDVAIGHRVTTLCNLGNIAYQLGRKLRWDAQAERFVGDEQADRLLDYPYRPPWRL